MEKDSANPSLKDTQKLILNASKIKRQHGRNEVRIIKNKNLDVFFLVHDERNKKNVCLWRFKFGAKRRTKIWT